jgi:ankyrin repeat protein
MHFYGFGTSRSITEATKWLKLSAERGYPLAMALCSQLNSQYRIGLPLETEMSWLMLSAQNGSKPAMAYLRSKYPTTFTECRLTYQNTFWALSYGLSEEILREIQAADRSEPLRYALCLERVPDFGFTRYGDSLLHCAALTGCQEVVRHCIEVCHMNVDALNRRGETAFLLACKSGHGAIVDLLLDKGADPNICNTYSENGLHWLCSFQDEYLLEYAVKFVQRGMDLHRDSQLDMEEMDQIARTYFHRLVPGTPLHRAAEGGNALLVHILLYLGADPWRQCGNFTPLCRAVKSHNMSVIRQFLDSALAVDINKSISKTDGSASFTLIQRAIHDYVDSMVLHYINDCYNDQAVRDVLEILTRNGAKLTGGSHDTFWLALARRSSVAADYLLSSGLWNIEYEFEIGSESKGTALAIAVNSLDIELVDVLLSHGADPDTKIRRYPETKDEQGTFILHICAKFGPIYESIARSLIKAGADVNAFFPHDPRETSLAKALSSNHFGIANLLIDHGACLDGSRSGCWPAVTPLNLLTVGNFLDQTMVNAYEFLINHPRAQLPFWTIVQTETVFHALFRVREFRRRNRDLNTVRTIFYLLRRQFPDLKTINTRNPCGWMPLHFAVYHVNTVGVQVLLEAGCDPRQKIRIEPKSISALARTHPEALKPKKIHRELYNGVLQGAQELNSEIGNIQGKSAIDLARENIFESIPDYIQDNPDDYDEFIARRNEIKRLLQCTTSSSV